MISIKKYLLAVEGRELLEALLRSIRILLHGIGVHAVEGDQADLEKFRADVLGLEDRIKDDMPASEFLVLAGVAVKALEDYNRSTTRFLHLQESELQNMVSMLTETVASIAAGSDRSVMRLQEIEKQLARASMIEDIRLLRLRLSECLGELREESERQRTESSRVVSELKQEIERTHASGAAPDASQDSNARRDPGSEVDPLTGLPGRQAAEEVLAQASSSSQPVYAVAAVAMRLHLINGRFGYSAGDRLLGALKNHLAAQLTRGDRLYRWSGPAFLAILERPSPLEKVQEELSRIQARRAEEMMKIGGRSILLPLTASYAVFPMMPSVKLLIRKIDSFIAAQLPRGDY